MPLFTEDQLDYRKAADDFASKHFSLEDVLNDERNGRVRDEVLKDAQKQGFTSLYIPDETGKFPYDTVSMMMIAERLCKSPSGGIVLIGPGLPLAAVLKAGSPQQQAEIRKAMEGEMPARFAFALTEPGVGSDATQIRTKAVNDGDYFVLNGTKAFITGAGYVKEAAERGYAVVMAQMFDIGNKLGIRGFIVRGDNPGYQVSQPYDKMGLHASDTREVFLDNCRVHKDAMLGIHAKDFAEMQEMQRVMKTTLDTSRPFVGVLALGIASAAYDRALEAAQTKQIRGKPLIQFQAIRHTLAEMRTELEAVAQLTYSSGRTLDRIFARELNGFPEEEASMAKYLAADTAVRVCRRALEIFGGDGYMNEMGMSMYANAAAVFPIWEGTENIQLETIGRVQLDKERRKLPSLTERAIPALPTDYVSTVSRAAEVYDRFLNDNLKSAKLDENQATKFALAKMRSQLEAAYQLGEFAQVSTEGLSWEEKHSDERVLMATVYARRVAADVFRLAGDFTSGNSIVGQEIAAAIPSLQSAQFSTGATYTLLDRIAGTGDNLLLKPSGKWY